MIQIKKRKILEIESQWNINQNYKIYQNTCWLINQKTIHLSQNYKSFIELMKYSSNLS